MLTLRKTALLLSTLYLVLLFVGMLLTRYFWFYPKELEQVRQLQQKELDSFQGILKQQLKQQLKLTVDYSHDDDIYQFIRGSNSNFVEANFIADTYTTLGFDAGAIATTDGEIKISQWMSENGELNNGANIVSDWFGILISSGAVSEVTQQTSFYKIHDQLFMISISEITDSEAELATNGYLLFARAIQQEFWEEIAQITRIIFAASDSSDLSRCQPLNKPVTEITTRFQRCLTTPFGETIEAIHFSTPNNLIPKVMPEELYFTFIVLAAIPTLLYGLFLRLIVEPMRFAAQHMEDSDVISPLPDLNTFHWLKIKELEKLKSSYNQLISRIREHQYELTKMSKTDKLTGIGNRRAFEEALNQTWRRAIRHKDNIALILIDIDYFKPYNDHYGHQQGDVSLRKVAQSLNTCIQRQDENVFRYGGEEFVAICYARDANELNNIRINLKNAINQLRIPHHKSKISDQLTASCGIAWLIESGDWLKDTGPKEWIRAADAALYEAKAAGRNCSMLQIVSQDIRFTATPVLDQSQPKP